tara:strand:+ start:525 stop:938 length:414 start_codon:yes stop_codon:yes gene_type:complete
MKLIKILLEKWTPDTGTFNGVTTDKKIAGSTDSREELFKHIDNLPDTVRSVKVPINTVTYKTSSDERVIENSPGYKEEIKAIVGKLDAEYQEKGQKVTEYTLNAFDYKESRLYINLSTKESDDFEAAMSRGDYGPLD